MFICLSSNFLFFPVFNLTLSSFPITAGVLFRLWMLFVFYNLCYGNNSKDVWLQVCQLFPIAFLFLPMPLHLTTPLFSSQYFFLSSYLYPSTFSSLHHSHSYVYFWCNLLSCCSVWNKTSSALSICQRCECKYATFPVIYTFDCFCFFFEIIVPHWMSLWIWVWVIGVKRKYTI